MSFTFPTSQLPMPGPVNAAAERKLNEGSKVRTMSFPVAKAQRATTPLLTFLPQKRDAIFSFLLRNHANKINQHATTYDKER